MYLVFFLVLTITSFFDDDPPSFFKKSFMQNIYKLSLFFLTYRMVRLLFFYTKNKYRFGQFLVTLLFFWGEEKYNHKSQSFRMIWGTRDFYTQSFTKIDFEIRLCWSSGTNNLECSIIRARSSLRTMGTGLTIHGFIITGRRVFLCLMSLLCLLCLRLL